MLSILDERRPQEGIFAFPLSLTLSHQGRGDEKEGADRSYQSRSEANAAPCARTCSFAHTTSAATIV